MKIRVGTGKSADTRVVPVFQGLGSPARPRAGGGAALAALLRSGDFSGRFLETAVIAVGGRPLRRIVVVGAGPQRELTAHRVRLWAGQAARRARELGAGSIAIEIPEWPGATPAATAEIATEGACLGAYRFTRYKREPGPPAPRRIEVVGPRAASARREVEVTVRRGADRAAAVSLARDLVATPGQDLAPDDLAARAREVARAAGARIRVLGVPELKRLGMGAVLAVGRGSARPPRFIVLERDPGSARTNPGRAAKRPTIVLIGKGVTFDTGGISLKPHEGMGRMKYDMAGAAAVLGVFSALESLDLPDRVVGLIPSAENMPGSAALKPGDIIRALDGTTIDVTNTDAEGRLLLADALCYAKRFQPDVVVDLATLTGSISIALGRQAAGLFTTDDALARELSAAGEQAGERLWRMPLWDSYADELRRGAADLENSGSREGGACIAAAFLAHFARGLRWAHLDIASTAWAFSDQPLEPRGPSGFGVRLLLEWLRARSESRRAAPRPAPRG